MLTLRKYHHLKQFNFDNLSKEEQRQILEYEIEQANQIKNFNTPNEPVEKKVFKTEFTVEEVKNYFDYFFEKEFKKKFIYTDNNSKSMNLLFMYFGRNAEFEKQKEGFSLQKGIGLIGGVGTGKTSVFKTFETLNKEYYKKHNSMIFSIRMFNCPQIVLDYKSDKDKRDLSKFLGNNFCFDDLGSEDFAFNDNLLKDILETRYHNRYSNNKILRTHFTSNLIFSQLNVKYGDRVTDRLLETTNFITLDGKSFRK